MTDAKEVKESTKDKPESVDDDSAPEADELYESHPMKEVHMSGDKSQEEREEVEEEEEEDDEDEEEEEEGEEVEEEEEEDEAEEEGEEDETEESEEDEEDMQERNVQPGCADPSEDGISELHVEVSLAKNSDQNIDFPINGAENSDNLITGNMVSNVHGGVSGEVHETMASENTDADIPIPEVSLKSNMETDQPPENDENGLLRPEPEQEHGAELNAYDSPNSQDVDGKIISRSHTGGVAPTARSSVLKVEYMKEEELENEPKMMEETMNDENRIQGSVCIFDTDTSGGGESGTDDEQAAFMHELERFHKERGLEFKPPKFYGEPLNLLKLWRAVMKLGGYDKVTACKYWRQVGESFKPPKTCTTVSWTFRIFYEKALVEYERYRTSGDGPSIPTSLAIMPMSVENQAPGSGRARRDAAARAMQGWHSQRILDNGEVSDPIIKDKNSNSLSKKEKQLKNLGLLRRKKPSSTDAALKVARVKVPKTQSETTVIDIGSPADWVKINVRETKDCYEVYALVPGLLREEVRVQSDPAGRLVISGEPENPDNPWNVTPFKKVVSLPSRIDPHQTSAVVTLHGQLFVRVPFEQYD